jgi:hypothetical protein
MRVVLVWQELELAPQLGGHLVPENLFLPLVEALLEYFLNI